MGLFWRIGGSEVHHPTAGLARQWRLHVEASFSATKSHWASIIPEEPATNQGLARVSSNRKPQALSGVILQKGIPIGGLAIPSENSDEFIRVFCLEYQALGLDAKLVASSPSPLEMLGRCTKAPDRQTQANPYNLDS